jgi:uncharacterized protein
MSTLKDRLQQDLSAALKARDTLTASTLRMALAAVRTEEVSGKAARDLGDDEVEAVLRKEVKKRREAADAYADAGRGESAEREAAESGVLETYLPAQLTDEELAALVADAVAETGAEGPKAMGQVMKVVNPRVSGRAEGGRVAAEVKRQLGAG